MTDTENLPALPEKWCWTKIKDIVYEVKGNVTPQENILYELYSVPAFENQKPEYLYGKDIGSSKRPVESEDVLLCKINPRINRVWIAKNNNSDLPQIASTEYLPLRIFIENIPFPQYLVWYFRSPDFREWIKMNVSGATGSHTRAKTDNIISQYVPLPPLAEQHRIVQKIEELFTDLDAGVKELEKAKVQIKTYRKAVLKAAFEGKLTEEWREKNIFADSESSLISKTRTQEDSPDNLCYFELPEKWFWTNLQELGVVSGGVTKNSKRNSLPEEIPYLRVANVYSNRLELEEVKCIGVREEEIEKYLLKKGDLLVVEGNGSLDQIGRVALWDGSIPKCIHQNHIIKVRFNNSEVGKYVLFWLLSIEGRKNITLVASSTSGLYTLSISKVSSLPVPIAPLSEQKVIVSEIERRFSVIDQIEKTIDQSLVQAEKLRQSILKKGFEGKLAPQDPNDEPASVLLERIKQEKGRAESRKKPEKKTKVKVETIMEVSGKTKQAELF